MIITGTSEWKDYTVSSKLNFFLADSGGIAARVQGLERYYGLELTRFKKLRLIKMLDGLKILKEVDFDFEFNKNFLFSLSVKNNIISGKVNEKFKIDYTDMSDPLDCGGIGLVVESGTLFTNEIIVN